MLTPPPLRDSADTPQIQNTLTSLCWFTYWLKILTVNTARIFKIFDGILRELFKAKNSCNSTTLFMAHEETVVLTLSCTYKQSQICFRYIN